MIPARLLAFTGLAVLAAAQWSTLLFEAQPARFGLAVLVAVLAAVLLSLVGDRVGRPVSRVLGVAVGCGAAAAGLVAIGLPGSELLPWHWDSLGRTLDGGMDGLSGEFDYPLRSGNEIARVILVTPMPLLLALAAVLGFRAGSAERPATAALVVALAAFAIPATARPTAAPLIWGLAMLAMTAVWLWGPRLRAPLAVGLLCAFGAVGVAAAGALAADEPPIDYRAWNLRDDAGDVSFNWDHTYGPIDWPRRGTPLFEVEADRPAYWRVETLDEFYSTAWQRSVEGGEATAEARIPPAGADPDWTRSATFTLQALETTQLPAPGTALDVSGLEDLERDADGTLSVRGEPLRNGAQYTVSAYAPDPEPRVLRSSAAPYPHGLIDYTTILIPVTRPDASLTRQGEVATPERVEVPLWRESPSPRAERAIKLSPYDSVQRLTDQLVGGKATPYAAARAIERYLKRTYPYSETPPQRQIPLRSFLFQDRAGFCQQFSGAMALMLRMAGIPSRVAVGFTAGTGSAGAPAQPRTFEVTDLDAHSWVEVYFGGIGWVTFDPTPAAAPSESQLGDLGAGAFRLNEDGTPVSEPRNQRPDKAEAGEAAVADEEERGDSLGPGLLVLAALIALALVSASVRTLRHRRLGPADASELQLGELGPALAATGRVHGPAVTLLEMESRLRGERRRQAAAYVRSMREHRYGAGSSPPGLSARRRLRRDLGRGRGLLIRLRLLVAMPPGGPRRSGPAG